MPFGMGFDELVLITTIVVVVFGATKLPDSRRHVRDGAVPAVSRWSRRDWLLVIAALVSAAVAGASLSLRH